MIVGVLSAPTNRTHPTGAIQTRRYSYLADLAAKIMSTNQGGHVRDPESKTVHTQYQYDGIGLRYNSMHELPAVEPEQPSVIAALGDVKGKRCLGA